MKKYVFCRCLCVLFLLLPLFTSCHGDGGADTNTEPNTTTTAEDTATSIRYDLEPENMPHDEKLLICGVNITSYRIVYGRSPLTRRASNTGKTIGDDIDSLMQGTETACDFDFQTAIRLRDLIKQYYNYDVEVVNDSDAKHESRYEILVGYTDRYASLEAKKALKDSADRFKVEPNPYSTSKEMTQYLVCGGSYGATWHAVDEIEKFLKDNQNSTTTDLSTLKQDNGQYDFTVVACVGDSITRGSQAFPDGPYANSTGIAAKFGPIATPIYLEQYLSYPATMQRELWKDAIVYNFGRGASTARNYGNDQYYAGSEQFKKCLETSNSNIDFDIVFLMHGTNDSGMEGGAQSWSESSKANFKSEIKNQIDKIREGSPNASFVLNLVPHACNEVSSSSERENKEAVRTIQKSLAKDLKDAGYQIRLFDMETFMIENLSSDGKCGSNQNDEWAAHEAYYNVKTDTGSRDPLHPNYRGYGMMAQGLIKVVDHLVNNAPATKYMISIE